MSTVAWYHGTKGDNVASIAKSGAMRPEDGKIFFSSTNSAGCFAMGADTKRKACFVIKVQFQLPKDGKVEDKITNVPGTKVLHTTQALSVKVLEMYVRKPGASTFETITGSSAVLKYLSR